MNKYFLFLMTGLLLQIFSCSGSPVLSVAAEEIFCSEMDLNFISKVASIPEGINAKESTGFVFKENKRIVAALLTLSLGMLGVHRIYLGSKPWVPLVYLLTFGGGFFILPLIDLIAILTTPDIDKYINNPRVFMWIEPEKKIQEVEK